MNDQTLSQILNIKYPIIMAPMFLVTNKKMMIAADKALISGCIPCLNFKNLKDLDACLAEVKKNTNGSFGVNLIVSKSNIYYKDQLEVAIKNKVDYIITSLGSPKEVIEKAKPHGIKVFCDVVDLTYAKKVESLGADALIAVNSGAGGHAGKIPASVLIPLLKENTNLPVISAGGVGTGSGLLSMIDLGACGISMGTPFIACKESSISADYKNAIIDYKASDIVLSSKISGTPCTVINTPYVQKMGTEQNFVESFLNKNKNIKKYAKMLTYKRGMNIIEKAAFKATYKTVWCAGPSLEFVTKIEPIETIVSSLMGDYHSLSPSINFE